ncbi:cation:proton antiporter subunit C [Vallitalea pronyensis]|uniref:Cation:proton antiporter subunit C n=1 Tax=Vallitalea pronyensis TaxID=1348613 RepID=A0A8J8MJP0_9FIRM|nr:cation:proton antiporter subunit C [Vallitalea pronyensis]QUI22681.1 cation:proton antiporter subunit C [Vallitalea pronyensis]
MDKFINGETVGLALFIIGLYGLIARRNIIKTIISMGIIQSGIILFFLTINYQSGAIPPIGKDLVKATSDPLPQALMITAVVIGISITAVSLTMFITLYHRYGTTNWYKATKKRGENI